MRRIKIIIIFIILFTTTSCINYQELNDIGIINAIGIDYIDNNYVLTLNMLTPTEDNKKEDVIYTTKRENLNDCFNEIYTISTKRSYLEHTNILILSNNIKKEQFNDIFNFFLKRIDSRNNFNVIILENYNENIFKTNIDDINNLLKIAREETSLIKEATLSDVIKNILEMNISYIPVLRNHSQMEIIGYKTIYEHEKLLSSSESIALNFIRDNVQKALITLDDINYQINSSKTSIKIEENKININISSNLSILNKSDNTEQILKIYKKELKAIIQNFINNNALNYFKNLIYKHSYNYYKSHSNLKIEFFINIETTITKNSNLLGDDPFDKE